MGLKVRRWESGSWLQTWIWLSQVKTSSFRWAPEEVQKHQVLGEAWGLWLPGELEPVSVALLRPTAQAVEILLVATRPDAQGRGYAETLLKDRFLALDDSEFWLEVGSQNLPAQNLYRKLGFAEVGRRVSYYRGLNGAAGEDALIFTRPLAKP